MAIDVLNTGTAAGSGDGESLRSAMTKVNSNFGVAENAASKIVQASSADTTSNKVMLSDYAWRGAQLGDYFTYGGTANAITLTSANLRAGGTLIAGMKFRFKATTTNTGATTIAVDGGSAIACVTPTGVALPAGFIRTDVITECEYDGSSFVVSRKVESGSNANGEWTKWENGELRCSTSLSPDAGFTSAQGSLFYGATANWPFPVVFSSVPIVLHSTGDPIVTAPDVIPFSARFGSATETVATGFSLFSAVSSATARYRISVQATGKWY